MRGAERVHRARALSEPPGEHVVAPLLREGCGAQRECRGILPRSRRETGGAVLVLEQPLRFAGAGVNRAPPSPPPPLVPRVVERPVPEGVIAIVRPPGQEQIV